MNPTNPTRHFYRYLTACSGNWRNSIYISCQEEEDSPGYLLAADRDGQPVIMAVHQFHQLAGVWVDPTECCGHMTEASFEALFAQYLLWHCISMEEHPLRGLSKEPLA